MGIEAILFNFAELFEQIGNTLLTEGPMWISVKKASKILHTFIYVYSPVERAANPLGTKFWL